MDLIGKAVWYIETHFEGELSLDEVANAAGLSKFHLVRAFGTRSGQSVMRYVRARRLTEAAKKLINGNDGILDVAIEAGYGSHEAFTRAFRDQFGVTPDAIRKARCLQNIELVEPIRMTEEPMEIAEPRFEEADAMLIVGLKRRYNDTSSAQMPAQWQAFLPHIGQIEGQKGDIAFGVLCNSDDDGNIDYMTGVEVAEYSDTAKELDGLRVPPQTYAVFQHQGHVSEIRRTWKSIFGEWLARTERKLVDGPQLERYGEGFDPQTGHGDIEIWIPVAE
ncbi:AraC family transcriptional regulator [Aliiroseovarius sp. Z3]|uniref:AraC family transcriptional regulator n=1 Tax=Aliiroseovarius sp. Z3 TaxID=2811402 RepID=UPI0023B25662|nr:AraC family transcriptional regulator [Aliiroseovarius sp. Z3]MDE9452097.1 AraC family transcriptional regulator [Aliiroseovarius sp. Z3]